MNQQPPKRPHLPQRNLANEASAANAGAAVAAASKGGMKGGPGPGPQQNVVPQLAGKGGPNPMQQPMQRPPHLGQPGGKGAMIATGPRDSIRSIGSTMSLGGGPGPGGPQPGKGGPGPGLGGPRDSVTSKLDLIKLNY